MLPSNYHQSLWFHCIRNQNYGQRYRWKNMISFLHIFAWDKSKSSDKDDWEILQHQHVYVFNVRPLRVPRLDESDSRDMSPVKEYSSLSSPHIQYRHLWPGGYWFPAKVCGFMHVYTVCRKSHVAWRIAGVWNVSELLSVSQSRGVIHVYGFNYACGESSFTDSVGISERGQHGLPAGVLTWC